MTEELDTLSLAQLEALIRNRKARLEGLVRRRESLVKQIATIDEQIATEQGAGGMRGRGGAGRITSTGRIRGDAVATRVQNAKPLKEFVVDVLKASKKGLTLQEIQEAVLKSGYKTNSANFKNTLYQCMYHNEPSFPLDKVNKTYKYSGR